MINRISSLNDNQSLDNPLNLIIKNSRPMDQNLYPNFTVEKEEGILFDKNKYLRDLLLKSKNFLQKYFESLIHQLIMLAALAWLLFSDNIRMLYINQKYDKYYSVINIVLMIVLFIELILESIFVEGFLYSYSFFIDIISIIVTIMDIEWFIDFLNDSIGELVTKNDTDIKNSEGEIAQVTDVAKNIVNFLKNLRLIKITKLYKIKENISNYIVFHNWKKFLNFKKGNNNNVKNNREGIQDKEIDKDEAKFKALSPVKKNFSKSKTIKMSNKGFKLGYSSSKNVSSFLSIEANNRLSENLSKKNLNDMTSTKSKEMNKNNEKKTKIGVLLAQRTSKMLSVIIFTIDGALTLLSTSFYLTRETGMENGLKMFKHFNESDPMFNLTLTAFLSHTSNSKHPLLYAKIGNFTYGSTSVTESLRKSEKNFYKQDCSHLLNGSVCEAIFDYRNEYHLKGFLSNLRIAFVITIFLISDIFFNKDAKELVLQPIENMILKIKAISRNPIEALRNNEKEEVKKLLEKEVEIRKKKHCICLENLYTVKFIKSFFNKNSADNNNKNSNYNSSNAPLETQTLEETIEKIGSLLALSFGEAGADIIAKNMSKNTTGEVDPMIKGKKICGIYGFCDVRNFTDTSEVLQEGIMTFVNEIAEIVHSVSNEYGGVPNKNIGDAFLLVWKFPEKFTYLSKKKKELRVYNCQQVNQLSDLALISIILIFAKVYKSKNLEKYKSNEQLKNMFGGEYRVKIGFGISLGWSIEGAVGSSFKIDASYLSPNVNKANQLEEKTKEYKCLVIFSDKYVEHLSEEAQSYLRIIDIVNENNERCALYTVDLDLKALDNLEFDYEDPAEKIASKIKVNANTKKKLVKYLQRSSKIRNFEDAVSFPPKKHFWNNFTASSKIFKAMREKYSAEFYKMYNEGFDEFHFGDWNKAREYLNQAFEIIGRDDYITERMINIMKSNNYVRPKNWNNIN